MNGRVYLAEKIVDKVEELKNSKKSAKSEADEIIKIIFDKIVEIIKERETLTIKGFGTFKKAEIPAKEGEMNGKKWKTEKSNTIRFKASKKVRERL